MVDNKKFKYLPREVRNKICHELFKQDFTKAGTHNMFTEDGSLIGRGGANLTLLADLLRLTSASMCSELFQAYEGTKAHTLSYRIDQVFTAVVRSPESIEHWEAVYQEKNEVLVERFVQGNAFHNRNSRSLDPITSLTFVFHSEDSGSTEFTMPATSPFISKLTVGGVQHPDKTPTVISVAPRSTGEQARKAVLVLLDSHKDVKDCFHAHASVFDASRIELLAKLFTQRCREAMFSNPKTRSPRICAGCMIGPKWQHLSRSEVPTGETHTRSKQRTWACRYG